MPDLTHMYSTDLSVDNAGDLMLSQGTQAGTERVIRRLMTSQGDYIFQLDYGAGLPSYLGQPAAVPQIMGVIRQQMSLEDIVSQDPIPAVNVGLYNNTVTASIQYRDSDTQESAVLSIPIVVT